MSSRVSLAELAAAGFRLHSAEAAAIVVEVCRQYSHGLVRGIPSAHVIRLTPDGEIIAEGPITTDRPPLAKAAQLLNDLLPPFDAPPAYRVPGALRLLVARALGAIDLPAFQSLDEFSTAVGRFASTNLVAVTQNLYVSWECSRAPRAPTISDVRRARRATGLSLEDISSLCGVRTELLREMEWGYLKNWRNDAMSRSWLAGYAKASGLDEHLVTSIVVPMLDEEVPYEPEAEEAPLVVSISQAVVPAPAIPGPTRQKRLTMTWAFASAAVIALAAVVGTTIWSRPAEEARIESPAAPDAAPEFVHEVANPRPVPTEAMRDVVPNVDPEPSKATPTRVVSTRQTRTVSPSRVAKRYTADKRPTPSASKPPPSASKPPPSASKPPSKPNFFKREVLRIVIK